jgi:transposase InsO family protein
LVLAVSERRAGAALGQHRSTQRKVPRGRDDEERLTADIVALARQYGRYGYRKIAALLRRAGWLVNDKRVERIWRREGLKVPSKQPKRGRLWLTDGSCIRLRAEHRNHLWSYDFLEDRTHDGRKYRMLNIVDEFTHECLAIRIARRLKAVDAVELLPISSSSVACQPTFDPTAPSSSQAPCGDGLLPLAPRQPTSRPAARGRTAISRASTPACVTS